MHLYIRLGAANAGLKKEIVINKITYVTGLPRLVQFMEALRDLLVPTYRIMAISILETLPVIRTFTWEDCHLGTLPNFQAWRFLPLFLSLDFAELFEMWFLLTILVDVPAGRK